MKKGHPPRAHGDQLWALALAVYATKESGNRTVRSQNRLIEVLLYKIQLID